MSQFMSVAVDIVGGSDCSVVFQIPQEWAEEGSSKREETRRCIIDCFKDISLEPLVMVTFGDECSDCMSILSGGECRNPYCVSKVKEKK